MLNYDSFDLNNLILEPITESDILDVFELFSNKAYCKYFMPALLNLDQSNRLISKIQQGKINNKIFNWGIYLKKKVGLFNKSQKGKLIGLILFEKSNLNEACSMISDYSIDIIVNESYSNQKIGVTALAKVVDYLIKPGSFNYVTGWTSPYNFKSIRLFRKLGFTFLGINLNENVVFVKISPTELILNDRILNLASSSFVPVLFSNYSENLKYRNLFDGFPTIETERLLITYFKKGDKLVYQELINEDDIAREFNGSISLQDAENLLCYSFPKAYLECKYITWAIRLKETGEIVGLRDLYVDSPNSPIITQGFIGKKYRNNGFHQECLKACIEFVSKAGFNEIVANCSFSNATAQHILEKLNFRLTDKIDNTTMPWTHQNRLKYKLKLND